MFAVNYIELLYQMTSDARYSALRSHRDAKNSISGVPRNFFQGGSKNSVEYRGQKEWGFGGGSPLVRGYTQFANE
jgi:hypothetical protein